MYLSGKRSQSGNGRSVGRCTCFTGTSRRWKEGVVLSIIAKFSTLRSWWQSRINRRSLLNNYPNCILGFRVPKHCWWSFRDRNRLMKEWLNNYKGGCVHMFTVSIDHPPYIYSLCIQCSNFEQQSHEAGNKLVGARRQIEILQKVVIQKQMDSSVRFVIACCYHVCLNLVYLHPTFSKLWCI